MPCKMKLLRMGNIEFPERAGTPKVGVLVLGNAMVSTGDFHNYILVSLSWPKPALAAVALKREYKDHG